MQPFISKPVHIEACQVTEQMVLKEQIPAPARSAGYSWYPVGHKSHPEGKVVYFYGCIHNEDSEEILRFEIGDWLVKLPSGRMICMSATDFTAQYQPQ